MIHVKKMDESHVPGPSNQAPIEDTVDKQLLETVRSIFIHEVTDLKKQLEERVKEDEKQRQKIKELTQIVADQQITIKMYDKQRVKNQIYRSMECKAIQTDITGLPYRELPEESVSNVKPSSHFSSFSSTSDIKPLFGSSDFKRPRVNQNRQLSANVRGNANSLEPMDYQSLPSTSNIWFKQEDMAAFGGATASLSLIPSTDDDADVILESISAESLALIRKGLTTLSSIKKE